MDPKTETGDLEALYRQTSDILQEVSLPSEEELRILLNSRTAVATPEPASQHGRTLLWKRVAAVAAIAIVAGTVWLIRDNHTSEINVAELNKKTEQTLAPSEGDELSHPLDDENNYMPIDTADNTSTKRIHPATHPTETREVALEENNDSTDMETLIVDLPSDEDTTANSDTTTTIDEMSPLFGESETKGEQPNNAIQERQKMVRKQKRHFSGNKNSLDNNNVYIRVNTNNNMKWK